MKNFAFFLCVALCGSTAALADDWSADGNFGIKSSDVLTIDGSAGVISSWSEGDYGNGGLTSAALVVRVGVAVCLGNESNVPGIVMGASAVTTQGGYGHLELGGSICTRVGSDIVSHGYLSGYAGSLRINNVASERYGANLGEIITVFSDPAGRARGTFDASVFVGAMQNLYYTRDGQTEGKQQLAVGARVRAMYRDLVHRIELEGQAGYFEAVGKSETKMIEGQASVKWLAVRLPNTQTYMYVGVQGNAMYAQDLNKDVGTGLDLAPYGISNQYGFQGLGTIGFSH